MEEMYQSLYDLLQESELSPWLDSLAEQITQAFASHHNKPSAKWQDMLRSLPAVTPGFYDFENSVTIGQPGELAYEVKEQIDEHMRTLYPWRLGPYHLWGTTIDAEWRSDWKWQRVVPALEDLQGKTVLDVGSNNGYFAWRMKGAGAKFVLGIEPYLLYVMQFLSIKHFLPEFHSVHVLPLFLESIPEEIPAFDTVFSMGVIYHRRSPIDHLLQLASLLRPKGQLVIESIVIEGDENQILVPRKRYAKMRNVWFVPSPLMLERWLLRCGFQNVQMVDLSPTTSEEQRSTEWMPFESFSNFLDPHDKSKTIEGFPAPLRAIFTANVAG